MQMIVMTSMLVMQYRNQGDGHKPSQYFYCLELIICTEIVQNHKLN